MLIFITFLSFELFWALRVPYLYVLFLRSFFLVQKLEKLLQCIASDLISKVLVYFT